MGCQASLYVQGLSHSLGKAVHAHCTAWAAHSRVPVALCGSFLRYYVKFPLLEGHYTTQIHLGFPWGDPRLCHGPPEVTPFSWAPVLLIPWGSCGISHSSARIPQFSAPEMFPPTPYGISYYFSPQRLATPSLFCRVPHFTNPLCFHISHLPIALWGPTWPPSVAGAFSTCSSNTRPHQMLPIPRHHAKYLDARSHFTDGKWRRQNPRLHGFAPTPPTSMWAFFTQAWQPHCTQHYASNSLTRSAEVLGWIFYLKKTKKMRMPPWEWGKDKMEAQSLWSWNNLGLISKFSSQSRHFYGSWYPSM